MPEGSRTTAWFGRLRVGARLTAPIAGIAAVAGAGAIALASAGAGNPTSAPPARATIAVPRDTAGARAVAPTSTPTATASATATVTATPAPPTATPAPPTPPPATATARPQPPAPPPATSTPVPPPPPAAPAAPAGLDTSPMDGYEQALFDATNRRRAGAGLAALRANGPLLGVARIRSDDMAAQGYFAHTSPVTGDTAFSLMDAYGVPYAWAGENLAKNNYPPAEAVAVADEALWNSPAHRENILNPNFTDVGIAMTVDANGMLYFTIIFSGP